MQIITDFEQKYKVNDNDVARWLTDELKRRQLPPTRIARPTVTTWRLGQYTPQPLMLEWLRDNAEDERVKSLAVDLLDAMGG